MKDTGILDAKDHNTWEAGRSFSLGNRVYRFTWAVVWATLASWTPPQMHGWRRFLLRIFGAKIAATAAVYPSVRVWFPANLVMGEFACLGPRVICYSMAKITLQPYSLASQGAHLCAGTHDIEDPSFQLMARPILVGTRAWVAADAFVGPGVTIGEGAVLGARGVAMKDVAAWMVYAGNPAVALKARRVRFNDPPV